MKKLSKKNRYLKVLILLLIPLLFTGCFNYNDINKVTFATSVIFDVDDLGRSVVYLDCIKPYRSTNEGSDKGRRMLYKGVGKTALEALNGIGNISSYKLNYSQTRAYIFTEKAAKEGIKKFLDLINNDNEFQVKPSVFIYYGDVEELLATSSNDEEYLGMLLSDLVQKDIHSPKAVESNINYYLSNSLQGNNTLLVPAITLKKDVLDKKIQIDGSSIMEDNYLVDKLENDDALMYNLMMGEVRGGVLAVGNPNSEDGFISLDILSSYTKDDVKYANGKLNIYKNINIDVSVSEIQGEAVVDEELIRYIEANEAVYVNAYVEYVFNKYKEKDIDIFDIERLMEIHYPKEDREGILARTNLYINTNVTIDGTGVAKNSL